MFIFSFPNFFFFALDELKNLIFLVPYPQSRKGLIVYLQSVHLSDITLSFFRAFLCSGRPSLSFVTLDQVLTELFSLMSGLFFCPGWSEESEIFYMASSWIVIDQVGVLVHLTFLYARQKTGRIMLWRCPSVCGHFSFPDFFLLSLQL
jgi:hypothetical protein